MGIGFQNISSKECFSAHKKILANADQKWASANTLADTGDFGGAVSLSIVSLEEQLKALLLLVDSHGFRFRKVKGMDAFFENHVVRYILAYYIFVIAVFGENLFRFIYHMRDNPDQMKDVVKQCQTDKTFIERKSGRYLMRKIIQLSQELEWFSRVDLFRQDGFYSDYDDILKTPIVITKQAYLESMERLLRVRFAAGAIIRTLQKPSGEFAEELKKMRLEFHKEDHYAGIASGLQMIRIQKDDPFGFIRKWFMEMRNKE